MSSKDDWKEIEEWQMSKEIEDIDKYGNIPTDKEKSKKIVRRLNKIRKIFQSKILKLLLIVFFILYCVLALLYERMQSLIEYSI